MIIRAEPRAVYFIWLICAAVIGFVLVGFHCVLPWFFGTASVVCVIILTVLWVYLRILIGRTYCKVKEKHIYSYSGVFFRRTSCVNLDKVLYCTVCKTPLSRISGLNFIIFNTFGGRIVLMFLSNKDCKIIEELL